VLWPLVVVPIMEQEPTSKIQVLREFRVRIGSPFDIFGRSRFVAAHFF